MASIQGIYVALFGRPADPAGLAFFKTATNDGADLTAIGDLSASAEYKTRFDGLSNTQVINAIYQSLFGHDADPAGLTFFLGELTSGRQTINSIAINILDGAKGSDLELVNAKIAAADLFSAAVDTDVEKAAYAGNDAAQVGRDYLSKVTIEKAATASDADTAVLKLLPDSGQAPADSGGSTGGGSGSGTVGALNSAPLIGVGGDGKVTTAVGSLHSGGEGVTVDANGKILVVGNGTQGSSETAALVRYNDDGSIDNTFGFGGIAGIPPLFPTGGYGVATVGSSGQIIVAGQMNTLSAVLVFNKDGWNTSGSTNPFVAPNSVGMDVTIDANEMILIAGYGSNGVDDDFELFRRDATNGKFDVNFGTGGKVTTDFAGSGDRGQSVAVNKIDGTIVVAGSSNGDFALARYLSNGQLDGSFSTDGKVTTDIGVATSDAGESVAIQTDDRILIAGTSDGDVALVRYNADGKLDTTFGTVGKVTTDIGVATSDTGESVTIQKDGKILVAGTSDGDFALVRYNSDGELDTTFGTGGKVMTDFASGPDEGRSVTIDANGKIVVAGSSTNASGSNTEFALARYNDDGSLDTTFDVKGGLGGQVNTKGKNPEVLDKDVIFSDAELSKANDYGGSALKLIRSGGKNTEDLFSNAGKLGALIEDKALSLDGKDIGKVVVNSGGELQLLFVAGTTQKLVNEVAHAITYANSSNTTQTVDIQWTFSDGNTGAQGTGGAMEVVGISTVDIALALVP